MPGTQTPHTRGWTLALALIALGSWSGPAQTFLDSPPNGMPDKAPQWHALTGATVHLAPGETLDQATVVVRGHEIVAIDTESATPPPGARVWDYTGKHIYAGFIDPFVEVNAPTPSVDQLGAHWNRGIAPHRRALEGVLPEDQKNKLRKLGFTAAALSPEGGMFRGYAAAVSLAATPADRSQARPPILNTDVYQTLAFDGRGEPNSLMGEIALLRQTFMDVRWNRIQENPANVLDAIRLTEDDGQPATPFLFVSEDELDAFRAQKLFREFGITRTTILGSGQEYQRLPALSAESSWILPLDFPKAPSLASVGEREGTELRDLMAWEQAPTNPARMKAAGFTLAFSTFANRDRFWDHLRQAVAHGLSPQDALAAITTVPASLLGLDGALGTIRAGARANLVVTSGSPFVEDAKVLDVWVDGARYEIEAAPTPSLDGDWRLRIRPQLADSLLLTVRGKKWTLSAGEDDGLEASDVVLQDGFVSFVVANPPFQPDAILSFSGRQFAENGPILGHAVGADGQRYSWQAKPQETEPEEAEQSPDAAERAQSTAAAPLGLPFGPYALSAVPEERNALFYDATIWTSGPAGIIDQGAMWIRNGQIEAIGSLSAVEAAIASDPESGRVQRLSLRGAHVTPGLIDCHSHTGISRGVNEMAQTVTAEVDIVY